MPEEAIGCGFHEAVRGVLSHHLVIRDKQDRQLPPLSAHPLERQPPRQLRHPGPVRGRRPGQPIFEENGPDDFKGVDIMRTVRSFDPACRAACTCTSARARPWSRAIRRRTERAMADGLDRLDDKAVAQRLARIDDLLERVEGAPGPRREAALDAVRALTEIYGEALARVLDRAAPPLAEAMAADELLGHLMVLHEIHPEPSGEAGRPRRGGPAARGARQLAGDVELVGIEGTVARVRLTSSGCGSGAAPPRPAWPKRSGKPSSPAAPELSEVEWMPDPVKPAAFVPLAALTHRPAPPGGPAHEIARVRS